MGLKKYRAFKDDFSDNGEEIFAIVEKGFKPTFKNRNTIQLWDITSISSPTINKWKGTTLSNNSLHEITIVNNSPEKKTISFSSNYDLVDEKYLVSADLEIGPNGTIHLYGAASLVDNNAILLLRTGSQDKRNLS